jgi:hypothetical protein
MEEALKKEAQSFLKTVGSSKRISQQTSRSFLK